MTTRPVTVHAVAAGLLAGCAVAALLPRGAGALGAADVLPGLVLVVLGLVPVVRGTGGAAPRAAAAVVLVAAFAAGVARGAAGAERTAPVGRVSVSTAAVEMTVRDVTLDAAAGGGPGAEWRIEGRTSGPAPTAEVVVRVPVTADDADVAARPAPVLPGDRVRAVGRRLHAGAPPRTPTRGRIHLAAAGPAALTKLAQPGGLGGRWLALAGRLRGRVRTGLEAVIPDTDVRALLACMVVGERRRVQPRVRESFRDAGLAHLLAVSGLHVVLVAAVLERLLRLLGRVLLPARARPRAATLSTVLLLPSVALYATACGGGVPVLRASLFVAARSLASVAGRRARSADHAAVAASVLLVLRPEEAVSTGFHLSFAAVLGLSLLRPCVEAALAPRHALLRRFPDALRARSLRVRLALVRAVAAALAAHAATAPLVAFAFGGVHPWAPLANLPAVALTAQLLPAAVLVAAAGEWCPPGLGPLTSLGTRALAGLAEVFASLPCAVVPVGDRHPALACAAGALVALIVVLRPGRRWTLGLLVASLALPCAPWRVPALPPGPALVALDVGHGQALLLRAAGRIVVVDVGGRHFGTAEREVRDLLRRLGVRSLDLLVVTHEDSDHCGDVPGLLRHIRVDGLVAAGGFGGDPAARRTIGAAREHGVPVRLVGRGDVVRVGDPDSPTGGVELRVLHPRRDRPGPLGNEGSLVLRARLSEGGRELVALLPADVEGAPLAALAHDATLGPTDVLLLPHHGRADPELIWRLIARARPAHVVASAARASSVRVRAQWVTGRDGGVVVTPGGARPLE